VSSRNGLDTPADEEAGDCEHRGNQEEKEPGVKDGELDAKRWAAQAVFCHEFSEVHSTAPMR